ncbi:hypothetical protein OAA60_00845 [Porticoccaceae bacterium]|nr:hypothetical protein [Porticoccaceae bacterium]
MITCTEHLYRDTLVYGAIVSMVCVNCGDKSLREYSNKELSADRRKREDQAWRSK